MCQKIHGKIAVTEIRSYMGEVCTCIHSIRKLIT